VMLVCAISYVCGWLDYFPLAAFTFLVLIFSRPEEVWKDSIDRSLNIAVGIAVAMLVNYTVSLYRYRDLYVSQLRQLLGNMAGSFEQMTRHFTVADVRSMERVEFRFHLLFKQISMFMDEMSDLKNELRARGKSGGLTYGAVVWLARMADTLAAIAHHSWDIVAFSPEIIREGLMGKDEKAALDGELASLAERLRGIVALCDEAGASALPAKSAPRPEAEKVRAGGDLRVISLAMSCRHLRREVEELAEIAGIFLSEMRQVEA